MLSDQTQDKQMFIQTEEFSKELDLIFNKDSQVFQIGKLDFISDDEERSCLFQKVENFEQKKVDKSFECLLEEKKFKKKNKNTPRFIVGLAVDYLPTKKSHYKGGLASLLEHTCQEMKDWHSQRKKNVYNLQHLQKIFGNQKYWTRQGAKLNRQQFSQIINKYSLKAMMQPRSQIADKVAYLRAIKVFNLRCRNKHLVCRNQSE